MLDQLLEGEVASATAPPKVNIIYVPRDGSDCSECTIGAKTSSSMLSQSIYNNTPTFRSYEWSSSVPISTGVSGFFVEVVNGDNSTTYGNGASPFPFQDLLVFELQKSCVNETFDNTGMIFGFTMVASVSDSPFHTPPSLLLLSFNKCRRSWTLRTSTT